MPRILLPRRAYSQPQRAARPANGWGFVWTPQFCNAFTPIAADYHSVVSTPLGVAVQSADGAGPGIQVSDVQDPLWDFGTGPFCVVVVGQVTASVASTGERSLVGSSDLTNHWKLYLRSNGSAFTVRASHGLTSSSTYNIGVGDIFAIVTGRDQSGATYLKLRNVTSGARESRAGSNSGAWYLRTAVPMKLAGHNASGFPGNVAMVAMCRQHRDDVDDLLEDPWRSFASDQLNSFAPSNEEAGGEQSGPSGNLISIPRRLRSQPQGRLQLDPYWAAKKPVFISLPGVRPVALCSQEMQYPADENAGGAFPSGLGRPLVPALSPVGRGHRHASDAPGFHFKRSGEDAPAKLEVPDGSDWSIVALIDEVNWGSNNAAIFRSGDGSGSTYVFIPSNGLWIRNNGTDFASFGGRPPEGSRIAVGFSMESGARARGYIDGSEVINQTTASATGSLTGDNGISVWGRNGSLASSQEAVFGNWAFISLWHSALSKEDQRALAENPWQVFREAPIRVLSIGATDSGAPSEVAPSSSTSASSSTSGSVSQGHTVSSASTESSATSSPTTIAQTHGVAAAGTASGSDGTGGAATQNHLVGPTSSASSSVSTAGQVASSNDAAQIFFGEDLGDGSDQEFYDKTNSYGAWNDYFDVVFELPNGFIDWEDFDSHTPSTTYENETVPLAFQSGTGSLTGGYVTDEATGGRYAEAGNYWDHGGDDPVVIEFPNPAVAFGFFATDMGDYPPGERFSITLSNGKTYEIPHSLPAPSGSILYWGVIDPGNPFTSATINVPNAGTETFGLEGLEAVFLIQSEVLPAASYSSTVSEPGAISQSHHVGPGISISSAQGAPGAITQEHRVVQASTVSATGSSPASLKQTHRIAGGGAVSGSVSAPGQVKSEAAVSAASSTSASASSAATIAQAHRVEPADSVSLQVSAPSSVSQEHRVAAVSSASTSESSLGMVRGPVPQVRLFARMSYRALSARVSVTAFGARVEARTLAARILS